MIAYMFYFKPISEYSDDNRATLYAYTNNKEYYQEFKKQRNMDNFIIVKEEMKKEEFLLLEQQYTGMRLHYGQFRTSDEIYGKKKVVNVLCTWREEMSIILSSDELWKEYSIYLFDCKAFKSEYIKALEKLLFIKFYGFYRVKYIENSDYFYEPYYTNYGPCEGLIKEEFSTSYSYDDLKLFIKMHSNTF